MGAKLFESELKILEVLWREGELPARRVAEILRAQTGWNINTTYTVIKKCVAKGAVERREPNFVCRALVTRDEVQRREVKELADRMFGGSAEQLFQSLLGGNTLSREEIERIQAAAAHRNETF